MMKGRAARTVLALSIAAALAGASPAVALGAEGRADTPVYIDVERAVLRVAVPMDVQLVAPAGGGALACPDNFRIQNLSVAADVYVAGVEAVYSDANRDGASWRLVDDTSLVGPGRETDGARLANALIALRAEGEEGDEAITLAAGKRVSPASPWKIARAASADEPSTLPIAFAPESACSIVRDAKLAFDMSQGDASLGIDAASAFRMKFTITTMRP